MTQPDYQRFAIVPLDAGEPVPDGAICHGDRSAVMGRIKEFACSERMHCHHQRRRTCPWHSALYSCS